VSGASPLIDTATVSVGQVMAERTVQEIPLNGRHFVDLGPLMPGGVTRRRTPAERAAARPGLVLVHVGRQPRDLGQLHGQRHQPERPVESQVTFQPSINTVSEFKVRQLDVQRRVRPQLRRDRQRRDALGQQQLHGEAFDFYRDQKFDSRNYFNPASLDSAGNVTSQSLFNRKQFGANVGGPVVKNRSFFFRQL
jgi:hypothetical protein